MEPTQYRKPRFLWLKISLILFLMFIVSGIIALGGAYFGLRYLIKYAKEQQSKPQVINFDPAADAPILGSASAPVTIIEFADFQCPFCKAFNDFVFERLKKDYIDTGKVKFIFQDLAFLGQESIDAAVAAKCAKDQNRFWEYNHALYAAQTAENAGDFSEPNLQALAQTLNLNADQFSACLTSKAGQAQILAETERASSLGINSTPTLLVNSQVIEGISPELADQYYQDLSAIIDKAIENSK